MVLPTPDPLHPQPPAPFPHQSNRHYLLHGVPAPWPVSMKPTPGQGQDLCPAWGWEEFSTPFIL